MPRPQTPLAKAKLTGANKKDPQRFRGRSAPKSQGKPVGDPPTYFNADCKEAWRAFARELGWLEYEDRGALEVAAICRGQLREAIKAGEPVTAAMLSAANTAIGKLGASPTDRGKVFQAPPSEDDDDPFSAFDGKPH